MVLNGSAHRGQTLLASPSQDHPILDRKAVLRQDGNQARSVVTPKTRTQNPMLCLTLLCSIQLDAATYTHAFESRTETNTPRRTADETTSQSSVMSAILQHSVRHKGQKAEVCAVLQQWATKPNIRPRTTPTIPRVPHAQCIPCSFRADLIDQCWTMETEWKAGGIVEAL